MVKKLVPDPFLKNQNRAYLWINSLKSYTVCFYCMASSGLSKYIKTKMQTTCFHLILSLIFCISFEEKYFSYFIVWLSFIVWFLCFVILSNMCTAIVFKPGCDVMNFEINPQYLPNQAIFFL